ncbi:acyl-CoA dehydrogenase family protein [Siccirubricoccus deserti]
MSDELRTILLEQVDRLLADNAGPDLLRANERGIWPERLWAEAEALGLPLALAPEAMGGAGLGWDDAVALWQVLGRHAAPLPLGESMVAAALLAEAGIAPPSGLIGLAVGSAPVAWGRRAGHLAVLQGREVALRAGPAGQEGRAGYARDPADAAGPGRRWPPGHCRPMPGCSPARC